MSPASPAKADRPRPRQVDPGLERDIFLRRLVRELAGTLEDTVGLEDASGFIATVGQRLGQWVDAEYKEAMGVRILDRQQVAEVLVDLKARIHGTFELVRQDSKVLEFVNGRCPFEEQVLGRPSVCMMTSNVFGSIAADNLGYAKVELRETIAEGDGRCHVLVHLDRETARQRPGREYFAV